MRSKRLKICILVTAMIFPSVFNVTAAQKHLQPSLKSREQRLQDVEVYISQGRERIEKHYANLGEQLRFRAQEKIRQIEKTEKANLAKEELVRKTRFFHDWKFMPAGPMMSQEQVTLAEQRIAEKKKQILKDLEKEIAGLERQKSYHLNTRFAEIEKRMKQAIVKPRPKPPVGTVTGIVYSPDKALAVVDGVILHPGDTIEGIYVSRIHKDRVEFEKDGNRWEQTVGQAAKDFWK